MNSNRVVKSEIKNSRVGANMTIYEKAVRKKGVKNNHILFVEEKISGKLGGVGYMDWIFFVFCLRLKY